MESESRETLEARLWERLRQMDAGRLQRLDAMLMAGDAPAGDGRLSRRGLVSGAAVAGISLVLGGAGGATAGVGWGDQRGAARQKAVDDEQIRQLRGLVALYEDLEKIGVDAVVGAGIAAAEAALKGLREGVTLLRKAAEAADAAAGAAESALPALRAGLVQAEGLVSVVNGQLKLLQAALYEASGKLAPVTDAIGAFLTDLIGKIPFGVGDRILEANRRLSQLVASLPATLEGLTNQLLTPLGADWLSEDDNKNLKGRLLTPVRQNLLKPLVQHLDALGGFLADLEAKLFAPGKQALSDRAKVRERITQYRAANGLA